MKKLFQSYLIPLIAGALIMLSSACSEPYYFYKHSGVLQNPRHMKVPFDNGANFMVIRPGNKQLLATSLTAKSFNVFDIASGKVAKEVVHDGGNFFMHIDDSANNLSPQYSPDGRYMLFKGRWENPDSKRLSSKGRSKPNHMLMDADTYEVIRTVGNQEIRNPIGYIASGRYVFGGGDRYKFVESWTPKEQPLLSLLDTQDWSLVSEAFDGDVITEMVSSRDSQYLFDYAYPGLKAPRLFVDYPVIRVWSVPELKLVRTLGPYFKSREFGTLLQSRDSRYLYVHSKDYEITGKKVDHRMIGQYNKPDRKAFTFKAESYSDQMEGELVFSGMRKVDLESGEMVLEFPTMRAKDIYLSHDDRYLFLVGYVSKVALQEGQEHSIQVYDTMTGENVEEIRFPSTYWSMGLAMSQDGKQFAMSYYDDIWVWDIGTH